MSSGTPCRVVAIEWERGHGSFEAIVRAESPTGVLVTEVIDLVSTPGLSWVRRDEITDLVDLNDDLAVVRLADLRGERNQTIDAALTELPCLLDFLAPTGQLLGFYRERTGSDELQVGEILDVTDGTFRVKYVNGKGRYDTGEPEEYEIAEIIRLDWGNVYLAALQDLLDVAK